MDQKKEKNGLSENLIEQPRQLPPVVQNLSVTSTFIENIVQNNDSPVINHHEDDIKLLRSQKMFPLFDNQNLAKISVNYPLYFHFLQSARNIFFGLFFFFFAFSFYFPVCSVVYESGCGEFNDTFPWEYQSPILILLGGIILRVLRLNEEKKILANQHLQTLQWTEDLFSVLMENIPEDVSVKNLEEQLKNILETAGTNGGIKDIIQLQDSYEHSQKKKRLANIEKKLGDEKTKITERVILVKEKTNLKPIVKEIEESLLNFERYRGKAVVIFSTFEAREAIRQYFKVHWSKRFKKRITVSQLTEPSDVLFENLYYPKFMGFLRTLACYVVGFPLAFLITYILFSFEESSGPTDCTKNDENGILSSFFFSTLHYIIIQLLTYLLEKIFERTYHYMIHSSRIEKKMSHQYFVIYTKTILFLSLQFFIVATRPACIGWPIHIVSTTLLLGLEILLLRLYKLLARRASTEFEPIEEVSTVLPFILFGFAFAFVNPIFMFTIILSFLYIISIIDKRWVIQYSEPLTLKSPNSLLRTFAFFELEHHMILFGGLVVLLFILTQDFAKQAAGLPVDWEHDELLIALYICGEALCILFFIILPLLFWRESLRRKIEQRFIEKNFRTTYDEARQFFSSTFKKSDPTYILKQKHAEQKEEL